MAQRNVGKNEGVANISLPTEVYSEFAEWCDRRRMVKRTVAGDVLRWFVLQPDAVKSAILDTVDQELEMAYADLLEQMAKKVRKRRA